ncbi:MAG: phosphoglycerate dehydrogenase [Schwartzia sp.]|nr:phosphoglycerate dehydrogenase [Schwartzia sp. (in: firmicutes)]
MKVLAADGVSPKGIEILRDAGFEVVVKDKLPADELLATIGDFDALIVRSASKVTKEVIEKADKLKIIGRAGVGVDNIDVPAATEHGIVVINSPGGNTIAATEHTMGMMLAMSRFIPIANETTQKGEWNRKKYVGVELRGKTLGVVGLGRIGAGVAKRAQSFEMNVIGYDPYVTEERAQKMGVELVDLDGIIARSDFITVHMPLTAETRNMFNKDNICKMKKGVRLINCARGGIINEQDLADAVKSGQVAGAAIDVYTSEPIPENHPLIGVPGIVLTPHLGASTVEAQIGVSIDVAEGIKAALNDEPVMTAVNMAPVSQQVMKVIKPYFDLAERLGCMASALADGPVRTVEAEYTGGITDVSTKLLTTAVLKGMLNPILETNVNYVNAPSLAKERGITVREVKNKETANFANLISVKVMTDKKTVTLEGALFGDEGRIVSIDGYRVDVDPHKRILICPHINRPGVIGKVGSIMGEANINISGMQVGKTEQEGTNIMVLIVDNDIPDTVIDKVTAIDGIFGAKLINFDLL